MSPVYLDDVEYTRATQCLVLLCADVLIISKDRKTFYLARRKSRPAKDWWWFIGGRRKFGELPTKSPQRCFERETGLRISAKRFQYVVTNEYFFVDRQQEPQDAGTHSIAQTYVVYLSEKEIRRIKLDPKEYHDGGLRKFTFMNLRKPGLRHPVRDTVRKILVR